MIKAIGGKFTAVRGEFKKITWPSRPELIRKTITVGVISLIFGGYIAFADMVLGFLFNHFISWVI